MRDALKHGIGTGSFDDRFYDDYVHILPPDVWSLVKRGHEDLADAVAGLNESIAGSIDPDPWGEIRRGPSAYRVETLCGEEDAEGGLPARLTLTANMITFRTVIGKVIHQERWPKRVTAVPCDDAAVAYMELYDSARRQDFETLSPGWLPLYSRSFGIEEAKLRTAVNVSLGRVRKCFDESPLFVTCPGHSVPEEPIQVQASGWEDTPFKETPFSCEQCDRRQERAEHETDHHFTDLALHHSHWLLEGARKLYPHTDGLGDIVDKDGWPLTLAAEQTYRQKYSEQDFFWGFSRGSAEEKEFMVEEVALETSKQAKKVATKPASSEWLRLLGVNFKTRKIPKPEVPGADDLLCALAEFNASIDTDVKTGPMQLQFWGGSTGFIPCLGKST